MKKRMLSLVCAAGLAFLCAVAVLPEPVLVVAEDTENTTITEGPLTFILEKDHASLKDCNREYEGAVEIPAEINGLPLTTIYDKALYECSKVTSISIPATVTDIGSAAFNTPMIQSNRVILNLDGNGLGKSLLTEINVADDNPAYASVDGVLFTKDMKILVQYPAHKYLNTYTVPDGVEAISTYAMSCAQARAVILPDSLISIQNHAFFCASTNQMNLSKNLKFIGKEAFGNACINGTDVIPENIVSIDEDAYYFKCPNTITILNPNCILNGRVFSSNVDFTLTKYTGTIRGYDDSTAQAYAEKSGCIFESLGPAPQITHLPGGICGDDVYWEKTFEDTIRIYGTGRMRYSPRRSSSPQYTEGITNFIIEEGVTSVLLRECTCLETVSLSQSITSIDDFAFEDCKNLTSITIPNSVTSIGNSAFEDCENLTSITIPNSVTSIGNSAFEFCDSLTSITIADSVTSIGDCAFSECKSLTSITIPDSVISIGDYAFSECENVTSITIPDSVISIGDGAFSECQSLTSITIPDSVTRIGSRAFEYCSLTIKGYTGSYAESYAKENRIPFESLGEAPQTTATTEQTITAVAQVTTTSPTIATSVTPTPLRGDVTSDGVVSVDDAQLTLKAYTERIAGNDMKLTDEQIKAADVNGDGEISVDDAQNILKYYTEKSVAGKDITWDDILGKKETTQPRTKNLLARLLRIGAS